MLELSTAQTDAEFEDVYRFWYDIYVTEMGRHVDDPNTLHTERRLLDPVALAGSLCTARDNGKVVGTILSTPLDNPAVSKYRELYQLEQLAPEQQWASGITTKFMVAPELRKTRMPMRLMFATYEWNLSVGIQNVYMDCNDHLLPLFTRMGFKRHLPSLYLEAYGAVNSMHLHLTDEKHLRKVSSPLLPRLQRFNRQQGVLPAQRPRPARVSYVHTETVRSGTGKTNPQPHQAPQDWTADESAGAVS